MWETATCFCSHNIVRWLQLAGRAFPGGPHKEVCPMPVPGAKGWRPKSKNFASPVHISTPYRDPIQPVREGEVQDLLGATSGSEKCTGFS